MARIRSVKPELCESETMAALPAEVERTFVRLWTHCDDEGRCKDNPQLLKSALFPLHDDVTRADVDRHLWALSDAGCIVRYAVDGARFLAVPSWKNHQHPQKPRKSSLPAPDQGEPYVSRTAPVAVPDPSGPVVEGSGGVEVEVGVEVAPDTSPQTTSTAPADPSPVDVEQQVRRAIGIYARTVTARTSNVDDPGAYAHGIGRQVPDEDRTELAERIAGGESAEDAAAWLADPLRGIDATTAPGANPAAVQAAADAAKRREAATAETLAAMRAETPAPPPANLRTHLRPVPASGGERGTA